MQPEPQPPKGWWKRNAWGLAIVVVLVSAYCIDQYIYRHHVEEQILKPFPIDSSFNEPAAPVTAAPRIDNTSEKIEALQQEVSTLQRTMVANDFSLALFDVRKSKGYARIDTRTGTFFISLDKVEPYLDGIKIFATVGNPTTATFAGFDLTVYWNKQQRRITFVDALPPGRWTAIDFVLAPAQLSETATIAISMQSDQLSLAKPNKETTP